MDKKLKCSASKPPDIIMQILNPKGLMIYLIQPLTWFNELIQQSLKFSRPASVLSIRHFFFPLFQTQPSIKSPVPLLPVQNLGRVPSPLCTGRSGPSTRKALAEVLCVQVKAKKGRATEEQYKALLETRGDTARLIYSIYIPLNKTQPLHTSHQQAQLSTSSSSFCSSSSILSSSSSFSSSRLLSCSSESAFLSLSFLASFFPFCSRL